MRVLRDRSIGVRRVGTALSLRIHSYHTCQGRAATRQRKKATTMATPLIEYARLPCKPADDHIRNRDGYVLVYVRWGCRDD